MDVKIRRRTLSKEKRLLITSDIHAHGFLLQEALEKAGYAPDRDILIIIGDMLEKGPDSLSTLRYVMELSKGGEVYPLMGNVDAWRLLHLMEENPIEQRKIIQNTLQCAQWWGSSILLEMAAEMGQSLPESIDTEAFFSQVRAYFEKEISFLQNLPTMLETEDMIFVHGGIPHERLDEFAHTDCFSYLKRDDFLSEGRAFQKWVAVGHWPVALYREGIPDYKPLIDEARRIISLDGGCGVKGDGQVNLLILPDGSIEQRQVICTDKLQKITALDAQQSDGPAHIICWGRHFVEMVEMGDEISLIRHEGYEMRVPTYHLYQTEGKWACNDISDYVMPVQPGDEMSLILSSEMGAYVKKNGVNGWYFGKYKKLDA